MRSVHDDFREVGTKAHAVGIGLPAHALLAAAMIVPDDTLRLINEAEAFIDNGEKGGQVVTAACQRSCAEGGIEAPH